MQRPPATRWRSWRAQPLASRSRSYRGWLRSATSRSPPAPPSWPNCPRRGYLDIILNAAGAGNADDDPPDPRYWDLFGKLSFAPNPSHSLSLTVLAAGDDLVFREDDEDEFADVETGYTSRYAWLSYLTALGSTSFATASIYWWASYVYSSIEDVIAGEKTSRYLNQPHAFTASASWRPGPKWALTGVLHSHTGWPGTAVSADVVPTPEGGLRLDYDIGPFCQEFWEDYLRLDLRASWTSRVGRRGEISLFIDVQNLTDRENQRGIAIADPDYTYDQAAGYSVSFPREN